MSKKIGAYQVIADLEEGGRQPRGERYLAEGPGGARVRLALFDLPDDEGAVAQARTEMAVAAKIDHPAILAVVSSFDEDGRLVVATETVAGALTAGQLIADEEALAPEAVWYVGQQIIGALALCHAAADGDDFYTICHGHLAPERILVDGHGRVAIEGLGLAPLVAAGVLSGKVGYEPPEHRGGGRVTPRGDIFSLAAILWALLEGGHPPEGFDFGGHELADPLAALLGRAREPSVGKRKVLSMEMEEAFDAVVRAEGRSLLVEAVNRARPRATLPGTGTFDPKRTKLSAGAPSSTPPTSAPRGPESDPLSGRGRGVIASRRPSPTGVPAVSPPAMPPPLRSRQATLLGTPESVKAATPEPRKPLGSTPPAIDWGEAKKVAHEGSVVTDLNALLDDDDDLDWGDEAPTQLNAAPDLSGLGIDDEDSDGPTVVASAPPPGVARLIDEDTDVGTEPPGRSSSEEPQATDPEPQSLSALVPQSTGRPQRALGKAVSGKPATKKPLADLTATLASARPQGAPSSSDARPSAPDSRPSSPTDLSSRDRITPVEIPSSRPRPRLPSDHGPSVALDFADDNEQSIGDLPPPLPADGARPHETDEPDVAALVPPPSSEASPWSGTSSSEPPRQPPGPVEASVESRPISKISAMLLSVGTAIVVMTIGVWIKRSESKVVVPPLPPSVAPIETSTAKATVTSRPRPRGMLSDLGRRLPALSATATASAAATASASAAPTAAAATEPETTDEGAGDLMYNQGYLVVRFTGKPDAKVFVFGKDYGKVGDKIVVPCDRTAFVTVGTAPGQWLSKGQAVKVACKATTRVTIEPK